MDIWICRNEINTILTEMTMTGYGQKTTTTTNSTNKIKEWTRIHLKFKQSNGIQVFDEHRFNYAKTFTKQIYLKYIERLLVFIIVKLNLYQRSIKSKNTVVCIFFFFEFNLDFIQIHQILQNVTIFTGELNHTGTRRLQPMTSTQFNLNNKFHFGANYLGWTFTSLMLFVSFLYVATDWHKLMSRDTKHKKKRNITN